MKTLLLPALLVAAFSAHTVLSQPAGAQAPNPAGANAPKFGIAVVDVGYIFKNHQGFKSQMDGMKNQMKNIEGQLKSQRDAIAAKEQQLRDFNQGTPDYKKLDEEIARMKADFNVEMTQLRKDFLEKEAKVYYSTYQEVDKTVKDYAYRQNIGIVLRFNGEEPDPNRRESILGTINKPVVFQNNIDITPDVLAILNRGGAARQATPPGNTKRR